MKISKLLKKPAWKRRKPDGQWQMLCQEDFLNELFPSAHPINSPKYKAMRLIYEFDDKKGEMVVSGWDDVERVTYGLEQIVMRSLPTHMFGNGVWFGNEGKRKDDKLIRLHKSHWNISGMNDAMLSWFHDAGAVGDSGLYMYVANGKVQYRVFSLLNDDIISKPNKNTFIRKFKVDEVELVEIYDDKRVSLWTRNTASSESMESLEVWLGETITKTGEISEDRWECVKSVPHGAGRCPVSYLRFEDVFYGSGVDIRERMERLLSYWGDSNNAFGMPILVLNSPAISLPPMGVGNKTMAFPDSDGKAEILAPPDASTSFTLDMKENKRNYCDVIGIVIVDQETLKGGDYSGAYLNNLYFPVVQWCLGMRSVIRHNMDDAIGIFLNYVGAIEGLTTDFSNLRMAWTIKPYTPENKMEEATIMATTVGAKITSRKTASGEIDHNSSFEDELLEEQDKYDDERTLKMKEVPAESEEVVKVEENVGGLKIDNKLKQ